jgi:hypothetical protein
VAVDDTLASGDSVAAAILLILVAVHTAAVVVRCRLASVVAVASGHAVAVVVGTALAVLGVV